MAELTSGRVAVLPAQPRGKVLAVLAHVPDGPDLRLVVDTGAGTSAVSAACAARLRLTVRRDLHVRTPTGLAAVGSLVLPDVRIGELQVASLRCAVIPLPDDRVDGLLGLDFFRAVGARAVTVHLDRPPRVEVALG